MKERLSQSTKIVSSRLIQTKRSLITLLFSFSRIKATLTTTYCTSPLLAKDIIKLGFYWNWLTSSAWYILVAPIKGLSSICTGLICPVAGRKLSWMFRTVWQKLSRFQLTFFQLFRVRARLLCLLPIQFVSCQLTWFSHLVSKSSMAAPKVLNRVKYYSTVNFGIKVQISIHYFSFFFKPIQASNSNLWKILVSYCMDISIDRVVLGLNFFLYTV